MNQANDKPRPQRSPAEQRERREMFGFHPDIVAAGTPVPRLLEDAENGQERR